MTFEAKPPFRPIGGAHRGTPLQLTLPLSSYTWSFVRGVIINGLPLAMKLIQSECRTSEDIRAISLSTDSLSAVRGARSLIDAHGKMIPDEALLSIASLGKTFLTR